MRRVSKGHLDMMAEIGGYTYLGYANQRHFLWDPERPEAFWYTRNKPLRWQKWNTKNPLPSRIVATLAVEMLSQ